MNKSSPHEVICKFLISKDNEVFMISHENVVSLPTILCDNYPIEDSTLKSLLLEEFGVLSNDIHMAKMVNFHGKLLMLLECKDWSFAREAHSSLVEKIFQETSFTQKKTDSPVLGSWFQLREIKNLASQGMVDQYSVEFLKVL